MDKVSLRLTVLFEEPFWTGVFESVQSGELTACRVVFGAEPKDNEIYEFILRQYYGLRVSPAVAAAEKNKKINPKRMRRKISRSLENVGIGTKSQQALKLQQEQIKLQRRVVGREIKQAEKQRRFELKQQKRKEKHKGR